MKQRWLVLIGSLLLLLHLGGVVQGESLWNDQSHSLYSNQEKVFHPGDLVTILIIEQSSATQQADSSNSEKNSLGLSTGSGLLSGFLPGLKGDWDSKYQGQGSTTRGGNIQAKITVAVKEVKPGGILCLEGQQQIKVNKERQTIRVTGNVRSKDVGINNQVLSSHIADAQIEFVGQGTVGETQNTGLLTKIFHWLF